MIGQYNASRKGGQLASMHPVLTNSGAYGCLSFGPARSAAMLRRVHCSAERNRRILAASASESFRQRDIMSKERNIPLKMLIDNVLPETALVKDRLTTRLLAEAQTRYLPQEKIEVVLSILPDAIAQAGAFLDEMTGIWRYEFGVPYQQGTSLIWGTHMWLPVNHLLDALLCAADRVSSGKLAVYLQNLADPLKHPQTLVEMVPARRIASGIPLDFEVTGLGSGNRTVDWAVGPQNGRLVLCDVKRRTKDFLIQFEQIGDAVEAPEPNHDPALLFRSVEHKFVSNNPDQYLQGAWIFTDIAQNENRLREAFMALDGSKVHFAILGDWLSDAYVLSRRPKDTQFLRSLFGLTDSTRFVFTSSEAASQ